MNTDVLSSSALVSQRDATARPPLEQRPPCGGTVRTFPGASSPMPMLAHHSGAQRSAPAGGHAPPKPSGVTGRYGREFEIIVIANGCSDGTLQSRRPARRNFPRSV